MKFFKNLFFITFSVVAFLVPYESKAVGLTCRTPYNQTCTYSHSFSIIIYTYTVEYEGYRRACAPDGNCDCSAQWDCQNEHQSVICIPSPAS